MKKLFSRFFILAAVLTCMTACSDDEPEGADKILHINDLDGVWLADDNDFFIHTSAAMSFPMDFNSTSYCSNGQFRYLGFPLLSHQGGVVVLAGLSPELEISDFKSKKGTMTIYNPDTRESKKYRRTKAGNAAVIANKSYPRLKFSKCEIYVHSEAETTNTLIYGTTLDQSRTVFVTSTGTYDHTSPFWLGGETSTVIAILTDENGKSYTAEWNNLKPDTYYTLNF